MWKIDPKLVNCRISLFESAANECDTMGLLDDIWIRLHWSFYSTSFAMSFFLFPRITIFDDTTFGQRFWSIWLTQRKWRVVADVLMLLTCLCFDFSIVKVDFGHPILIFWRWLIKLIYEFWHFFNMSIKQILKQMNKKTWIKLFLREWECY